MIQDSQDSQDSQDGRAVAMQPLLTEKQAAIVLSISPRKLWELRNRGEIPHVRIDRAVRYDSNDLRDWVDSQKKMR